MAALALPGLLLVLPGGAATAERRAAAPPTARPTALPAAAAADCDSPRWQQVASPWPAGEATHAQAVWRDARELTWPVAAATAATTGTAQTTVYRLHHSATEVLQATPGLPVRGSQHSLSLVATARPGGLALPLPEASPPHPLQALLRGDLLLTQEDGRGRVLNSTRLQAAAALDALYGAAEQVKDLGAVVVVAAASAGVAPRPAPSTRFKLWAPTASQVRLCLYAPVAGAASQLLPMAYDSRRGIWQHRHRADLNGRSYSYLVDVFVRGHGWVRNRVTDPYSTSLTTDSLRSVVADLASPRLQPAGWAAAEVRHQQVFQRAPHNVDMRIYELHVRDFSVTDTSVPAAHRGTYLAFTHTASHGMRQLKALADAGITDLHLLPVFDIATIPEQACLEPRIPDAAADSEEQQAAVKAVAARDCFNWGYDPFHFNAPEGSYATDAMNGATRVREFRQMVMALHAAGLRVGMDVVYNHTAASGQKEKSVLDRVVPGYYQRYNAQGEVETSTCCDNTATEHRMMGKLLIDSLLHWARHYRLDSFRFDLMGHQPRELMERAQARLRQELGREIHFIGEGWNFGEVANNARFKQASQLELNGSGIATFSDRMRDAARGGGHDDSAERLVSRQGWLNGLHHAPNALAAAPTAASLEQLQQAADLLRVGLAGTLRNYSFTTRDGQTRRGEQVLYNDQPGGYARQPGEVVNYVENHDNQTLWDINTLRLPLATSSADRARVQMLGAALVAFSQGVAYFHAGMETLRSKSLDRNSYDSGDWFNRIDWTFSTNHQGSGLPPKDDNGTSWVVMKPFLANPALKPTASDLAWARGAFNDLLRIRSSSSLFRLRSAQEVQQRLRLLNTGPAQNPTVLAASLDGRGHAGAGFSRLVYFINTNQQPQQLRLAELAGVPLQLHPVHLAPGATDRAAAEQSRFERDSGEFLIPARSAVVYVQP